MKNFKRLKFRWVYNTNAHVFELHCVNCSLITTKKYEKISYWWAFFKEVADEIVKDLQQEYFITDQEKEWIQQALRESMWGCEFYPVPKGRC